MLRESRARLGLVNFRLLFVGLVIAGVGIWYFYLREGSTGVPNLEEIKIENPFADQRPVHVKPQDVVDPLGSAAAPTTAEDKTNPGKLVTVPTPPIKQADPKKTEASQPKSALSPREASLIGRWLAKWTVGSHNYTIEWDLVANGTAIGKRTQNANPIGQFPFTWYVADDTLVTEVGRSKAHFRHRSVNVNQFELDILSGVSVAPGQSRTMHFHRIN